MVYLYILQSLYEPSINHFISSLFQTRSKIAFQIHLPNTIHYLFAIAAFSHVSYEREGSGLFMFDLAGKCIESEILQNQLYQKDLLEKEKRNTSFGSTAQRTSAAQHAALIELATDNLIRSCAGYCVATLNLEKEEILILIKHYFGIEKQQHKEIIDQWKQSNNYHSK